MHESNEIEISRKSLARFLNFVVALFGFLLSFSFYISFLYSNVTRYEVRYRKARALLLLNGTTFN